MLNVLLVLPGQRDAVATALEELERIKVRVHGGQADSIRFVAVERPVPSCIGRELARERYDIIHLGMSMKPAEGPADGEAPAARIEDSSTILGEPGSPARDGSGPCVILDACTGRDAIHILPGRFPFAIDLPPRLGRDSAVSFLATFYETLTLGHSLQTAFWLACCEARDPEPAPGHRPPRLRIHSAPGLDPRRTYYGTRPPENLPAPSDRDFLDQYSELCREIEDTIAKPLMWRFGTLIARVYVDEGPVPEDQRAKFANDFAELIIAIYRGPRALELQREKFEKYQDPSRRYPNLYEWTILVEAGEAELETWLKDKTAAMLAEYNKDYAEKMGADWRKSISTEELTRIVCDRAVGFIHGTAVLFARRMQNLYSKARADTALPPSAGGPT